MSCPLRYYSSKFIFTSARAIKKTPKVSRGAQTVGDGVADHKFMLFLRFTRVVRRFGTRAKNSRGPRAHVQRFSMHGARAASRQHAKTSVSFFFRKMRE